ncbi:HAD-IIB family hydrolase [Spiroplasma alleghenense]|uniref:HAD family hydrolase n=1 Tax=Spiroplasma alleghenense TaxID=216931 RepID=A0A345Z2K2_9MOLU|nr:HAD-IIB family hydrolase [Spiroplasma alleghenense]AXK50831.1 HAD family hydrolase [Spiroplasma alleghenense]
MPEIKLLALDMDGTSYEPMGEIVLENKEAIINVIEKEIPVVFITGRPINSPKNKLLENGFLSKNTIMAGFNGACIFDVKTQKVIASNPISKDIVNQAFKLTLKDEYRDVIIWGYSTDFDESVINNLKTNSKEIIKEQNFFTGNFVNFEDLSKPYDKDCYKFLIFNFEDSFIEELKKMGLETAINATHTACEVTASKINKKYAIQEIEKLLKIDAKDIMAMGDGTNDIPMMEYVGFPVSFTNCVDEVKKISKAHIDLDWSQGAVAKAINKFILNK